MLIDLTIQEQHFEALRQLVLREDGCEGAAYILCGISSINRDPWERRRRIRFTSYEIVPIPSEDLVSADEEHITWSTRSFVQLLNRASSENLIAGIIHSHPRGPLEFSAQDDSNESELAILTKNRNGNSTPLLSILMTNIGDIRARLWPDPRGAVDISMVRIIGRRIAFHKLESPKLIDEIFARQALAFGDELNGNLRSMRIGVVGCGGTGSAVATLLARLGVGQMILFDEDIVEVTNLDRLHGACQSDANAMLNKVDVVAREIAQQGLGVRIIPISKWIGNPNCREALKSCDVIFGCTDDHDGRILLNRLAYFYLIPVIDLGLAIDPKPDFRGFNDLSGRVTILTPGAPCLLCRGTVDPEIARGEALKRQHPEEYERRKRDAYIRGAGNPSPAVVTFTTATACLAIDEMLQGLTNFRGGEGWAWQRVRRFDLLKDRQPGATHNAACPICVDQSYWGRADIEPFLDRAG